MTGSERIEAARAVARVIRADRHRAEIETGRQMSIIEAIPVAVEDWTRAALRAGVARLDTAGEMLVLHELGVTAAEVLQ